MHRCNASHADLVLDTWGWRFLDLAEAEAVHRTLAARAGSTGRRRGSGGVWRRLATRTRGVPRCGLAVLNVIPAPDGPASAVVKVLYI